MVKTILIERAIGPMEMFVMAAMSRGSLNTLYTFQRAAGLQPGSLKSVIQQLEKNRLLNRSRGTKRGRRVMSLTEAGERFLSEEWRSCLDSRREVESILRSATVALLLGETGAAVNFLLHSASERARRVVPNELGKTSPEKEIIDFHAEMRTVYEHRRRAMEANVLEDFAMKIGKTGKKRLD